MHDGKCMTANVCVCVRVKGRESVFNPLCKASNMGLGLAPAVHKCAAVTAVRQSPNLVGVLPSPCLHRRVSQVPNPSHPVSGSHSTHPHERALVLDVQVVVGLLDDLGGEAVGLELLDLQQAAAARDKRVAAAAGGSSGCEREAAVDVRGWEGGQSDRVVGS